MPFELVKIRLQDKASAGKYNGMLDVVAKTVRNEGVLAMYQGLESTLWRHILWNAGYFGCIFQVRQLLPKVDNKRAQMLNDILAGTVGGTVGTLVNTPMDVVKSRIQNSTRVPGVAPKYNWAWPAVGTVLKEEGFGALYKGFLPKVLRLGPGGMSILALSHFYHLLSAYTDFDFYRWYPPGRLPGYNGLLPQDERQQGIRKAKTNSVLIFRFPILFLLLSVLLSSFVSAQDYLLRARTQNYINVFIRSECSPTMRGKQKFPTGLACLPLLESSVITVFSFTAFFWLLYLSLRLDIHRESMHIDRYNETGQTPQTGILRVRIRKG